MPHGTQVKRVVLLATIKAVMAEDLQNITQYIYIYTNIFNPTTLVIYIKPNHVFVVSCAWPVKCLCLPLRVCQCIASTALLPQVTIVAQCVQSRFVSKGVAEFWLQRPYWKRKGVAAVAAAAAVTLGSLRWCCCLFGITAQMQCNVDVAQHRCNAAQTQRSTDTVQHI